MRLPGLIMLIISTKVCDFGLSNFTTGTDPQKPDELQKDTKQEQKGSSSPPIINPKVVGSIPWIAPEVFLQKPHSEKSDIFSYAVVCWEIFAEKHPYSDEIEKGEFDSNTLIQSIVNNSYRPRITKNFQKTGIPVPEAIIDLIRKMWHRNPLERPEWSCILEAIEQARQEAKVLSRWIKATETAPKTCSPLAENEIADYFSVRGSHASSMNGQQPPAMPNVRYFPRRRSSMDSPTNLAIPSGMLQGPRSNASLVPVMSGVFSDPSIAAAEQALSAPINTTDGMRQSRSISITRIGDISLVTTPDGGINTNPITANMVATTNGQVKPFNLTKLPEPRRHSELNGRINRMDAPPTESSSIRRIIPEESGTSIETASLQKSDTSSSSRTSNDMRRAYTAEGGSPDFLRRAQHSLETNTSAKDSSISSKRNIRGDSSSLRQEGNVRGDSSSLRQEGNVPADSSSLRQESNLPADSSSLRQEGNVPADSSSLRQESNLDVQTIRTTITEALDTTNSSL